MMLEHSKSLGTEGRSKRKNYLEIEQSHQDLEDLLQREDEERIKRKRSSAESDGSEEEEDNFELGTDQEEQETAWATNFSAVAIVEEEEDLIPPEANELKYVHMRNYVLAKWRAAVDRYMMEEEACEGLSGVQQAYARVAWRFLDGNGFINYGVAPAMCSQHREPATQQLTVVVVGAGVAGLAAAKQLERRGHRVLVLEGHARPGGRVYTKKMEVNGIQAVADMGGSILTGIDGNPLAVLARQLDIPMHEIEQTQVPLFLEDGSLPARRTDEQVEHDYNALLDGCNDFRDNLGEVSDNISLGVAMQQFWEDRCMHHAEASADGIDSEEEQLRQRFYNWHLANLEFANAASIEQLSVRTWDQDDPHELSGPHCFLPGGNLRVIAALTSGLKILYNSKVNRIEYSKDGIAVSTATHTIKGDAVVVTLPLGCLKHGDVEFVPPLPARKLDAIHRLGFGLLNKIILLFPYNFWGAEDMFGRLPEACQDRGEYYLFYSYAQLSGAAVLAGLVSGDAAQRFEERTNEEATERVMRMLRDLFEPRGITVPPPLQVLCTQWGKDEMARGSYSSMAVGALGGEDYDLLAESVGERVFFAGEATNRKYPATMHGAFYSGIREAANVVATLKAALNCERNAKQKVLGDKGREQPAESAALNTADVEKADLVHDYSHLLEMVFEDRRFPPDLEFGCFAAIRGPQGSQWEGKALLRVQMGVSARGRATMKANYVAIVLSLRELKKLQDVAGGNDARHRFLASLPGVKLVGRATMSRQDLGMIETILEERRESACSHKPAPTLPTFKEFKFRSEGSYGPRLSPSLNTLKEY